MTYKSSLLAQTIKNLPVMHETQVLSLDWEDLEKGTATHWTEEPEGFTVHGDGPRPLRPVEEHEASYWP